MNVTKVIIAGSRGFDNYEYLEYCCHLALKDKIDEGSVEIVSGGARGADKLGERFAKDHDIPVKVFKANWEKYGNSAGPRRNKQMGEYADSLIVFWDGSSKGTKHMMEYMRTLSKKVVVFKFKPPEEKP